MPGITEEILFYSNLVKYLYRIIFIKTLTECRFYFTTNNSSFFNYLPKLFFNADVLYYIFKGF